MSPFFMWKISCRQDFCILKNPGFFYGIAPEDNFVSYFEMNVSIVCGQCSVIVYNNEQMNLIWKPNMLLIYAAS